MAPIVSIIIPVYNRPVLVAEAIESVVGQTNPNWELIVVDDGSTDNTWEVLESYAANDERIRVFKRDREPKGAPTCRNIGAGLAKGEYLIFFDSDDLLLPHCVEGRLKAYKENPGMDFLVFPMAFKNNRGELIEKPIPECENYLDEFLSYRLHWQTMCPIWKKDFFLKLGGFRENLPRLNDPELMIRAFINVPFRQKVFFIADYDSLYSPGNLGVNSINSKVFKSLLIFLPEIAMELRGKRMDGKIPLLINYLKLWYKSFFFPLETSRVGESLVLNRMSLKAGVIPLWKYLMLNIFLLFFALTNFINFRIKKLILKLF